MEAYTIKAPTPPSYADLGTMCVYISEGVQHVLGQPEIPLSTNSYTTLYTVVYDYCTRALKSGCNSGASPRDKLGGEGIYNRLSNELLSHLRNVGQEAQRLTDHSLLSYYAQHWERYTASVKILNRLFAFLNRHWIKRERDEGRKSIYPVDCLAFMRWKVHVVAPIQSNGLCLTNALASEISHHRLSTKPHSNELSRNSSDGLVLTKRVLDSLVSLSIDSRTLNLLTSTVYKANFEEHFLSSTAAFYAKEAGKVLTDSTLANYSKKAECWLQDEENLATKYLHSSTTQPLLSTCEDILIRRHLDRFYGAFPSLLDAWKTLPLDSQDDDAQAAAELKGIYSLLIRLPEAVEQLREGFGEYVKRDMIRGLTGSAAQNPEAYRVKYGNLIASCFRSDPEFEKALDGAIRVFSEEHTSVAQES